MEAASKILSVAIGGSLGAVARHLINISPLATVFDKFPFPTFVINIVGSFLIGFLMIIFADKMEVNENLRMAIIVGFLGAFTTFSTFEMEVFGLMRERQLLIAFLYLFLSVLLGYLGVMAGVALGRRV
ncbi:MAG: fluoride efflux transporter CrcB [Chloracidobacterium sp.]|nr:fluoride efflux transporter CrcB [Chloracidobacterium sp.]